MSVRPRLHRIPALGLIALLAAFGAGGPAVADPDNGLHGRFEAQGALQLNGPQSIEAAR
jgi:hypothetical protein